MGIVGRKGMVCGESRIRKGIDVGERTNERTAKVLRRSFVVRRSSFVVCRSSFVVRQSSFVCRSFVVVRSFVRSFVATVLDGRRREDKGSLPAFVFKTTVLHFFFFFLQLLVYG